MFHPSVSSDVVVSLRASSSREKIKLMPSRNADQWPSEEINHHKTMSCQKSYRVSFLDAGRLIMHADAFHPKPSMASLAVRMPSDIVSSNHGGSVIQSSCIL